MRKSQLDDLEQDGSIMSKILIVKQNAFCFGGSGGLVAFACAASYPTLKEKRVKEKEEYQTTLSDQYLFFTCVVLVFAL